MRRRLLSGAVLGGVLALAGCSRPAVEAPVTVTMTEPAPRPVVRAQAADAPEPPRQTAPEAQPAAPFRFPADPAGALLAQALAPADATPDARQPRRLRRVPAVRRVEEPDLPLPPGRIELPRLPAGRPAAPLRPRLVAEDGLDDSPLTPALPERRTFATGTRVRITTPGVQDPAPLPVLARPAPERTATEDPTAEASAAAVLAAPLPVRATPAPFLRLTVPDPFERRQPLDLAPPAEGTSPLSGGPRTPGR